MQVTGESVFLAYCKAIKTKFYESRVSALSGKAGFRFGFSVDVLNPNYHWDFTPLTACVIQCDSYDSKKYVSGIVRRLAPFYGCAGQV